MNEMSTMYNVDLTNREYSSALECEEFAKCKSGSSPFVVTTHRNSLLLYLWMLPENSHVDL